MDCISFSESLDLDSIIKWSTTESVFQFVLLQLLSDGSNFFSSQLLTVQRNFSIFLKCITAFCFLLSKKIDVYEHSLAHKTTKNSQHNVEQVSFNVNLKDRIFHNRIFPTRQLLVIMRLHDISSPFKLVKWSSCYRLFLISNK